MGWMLTSGLEYTLTFEVLNLTSKSTLKASSVFAIGTESVKNYRGKQMLPHL